jgi:glycerol kinase
LSRAVQAVLALDQGSSSSRVIAFDPRGRALQTAQRPVRTYHPQSGWIEHDALDLARTVERSLDEVLAALPRSTEVAGAGLACQRSTIVFWDKDTGKPAARAPSWQDGRAAAVVAPLQPKQGEAHERTGLYLTPYYSAPKIRWFLDHSPQVRRLADAGRLLAGPVSTWLVWRLTKGEVFAADPTTAQRTMLLNLRTLDWDPEMLSLFGLSRELLPQVRPSAGDWGVIARGGRRVRLLAALGDQQAAALGLGGRPEGASVANYGTGAFFLHNTGQRQRRIPGLLTSVAWQAAGAPAAFLQEGTVHAAGTSFDWLRDTVGILKSSAELDALMRASKHRVWALPAIGGLGAPRWDYKTRTAFFGLTSQTGRAELVRGVAEGLAFLVADIVAAMRAGGVDPRQARVSGGLSRVNALMQFQADLLGVPLSRCAEGEATALGAASLAAEAAGASWAARLAQPRVDKVFEPRMSSAEASALHAQWRAFVDAQVALSRELGA